MKLRYSFVLFSVAICCIVAFPNVAASDDSDDESDERSDIDEYRECAGQYLKSKGLLDHEPPAPKDATWCQFSMGIVISTMRDNYDLRLRNSLPYEYVCIVGNIEKDGLFDLVIKRKYIQEYDNITKDERKTALDNIKTSVDEKLNAVVGLCGGRKKKIRELVNAGFFWAEQRNGR